MSKRNALMNVFSHTVASTETINKSVGKGKKVTSTKGDKKVQQPEQEVIRYCFSCVSESTMERNFLNKAALAGL